MKDEERVHIISALIRDNRYKDLAMFYINVDFDFNSEDIFEYSYLSTNKRFYYRLYEYVGAFLVQNLKKLTISDYITNILDKTYIDVFNIFNKNSKDYILYNFIRDLCIYVYDIGRTDLFMHILHILSRSSTISKDVFKILIASYSNFTSNSIILEDIILNNYFDLDEMLYILESKFNTASRRQMDLFMRILTVDDEKLIKLISIINNKYELKNKKDEIIVKSLYRSNRKEFYDYVRLYLTDKIVEDSENDIYSYIDNAINVYMKEKNMMNLDLYTKIEEWISSEDRRNNMIYNYNKNGHEDDFNLLNINDIETIDVDVFYLNYISNLEELNTYDLFIRLFNINRFNFLSSKRSIDSINLFIKDLLDYTDYEIISTAISSNTYNLLLNY